MVTRIRTKNSGKSLNNQIRRAIKQSKLTVNAVAVQSGIPQQLLSRFMLDDTTNIRLDTADKLAQLFCMTFTQPKYTKVKR